MTHLVKQEQKLFSTQGDDLRPEGIIPSPILFWRCDSTRRLDWKGPDRQQIGLGSVICEQMGFNDNNIVQGGLKDIEFILHNLHIVLLCHAYDDHKLGLTCAQAFGLFMRCIANEQPQVRVNM